MKKRIPTIGQLVRAYPLIAAAERMKCDRPGKLAVSNVISAVRHVCRTLQLKDSTRWSRLDRVKVDMYLTSAARKNVPSVTAWSYISRVHALCAKWCRPYWDAKGWDVASLDLPVCRRRPSRYVRPERSVLLKLGEWYRSLALREDRREWLVATLMLEFGMRNGDIGRLRWSNFRERDGVATLCYTPHKTSLTSGRTVAWPVHPEIWERLCMIRGQTEGHAPVVPESREVFGRLNKEIKDLKFFHGTHKGLYELRKICIDHIYQRFGAEMASSISGDDIRTVTRYYADPSAVNVTGVRIIDLL